MRSIFRIITVAVILLAATASFALEVPALKGRVNDYGDMISPSVKGELEQKLKAFEESDSTQIVILTVNSLEGDALEDYTIRVAEKWKIGQAKKDNGVIIFAAKNDRKMRIEVGRGLEGVLTDLLTGRILDNIMRPKFRAGDFDGGFTAGVDSVIQASRGEFKNDGASADTSKTGSSSGKFFTIMLFVIYFAIIIVARISKVLGGGIGAVALPAMIHFGIGSLGLAGLAVAAVAGFVIAMILPYLPIGGGGFIGGSGSSSGGGFSGGGGSFGGGGSSGGW